ncbi:MAG TPA: hypothetical protein VLB84_05910 [Bacteroidia bacterium]|nr:hypothetical protein [Bacteroidia bacterium]
MSISKYIVPIQQNTLLITKLLIEEFSIDSKFADQIAKVTVRHFDNLLDTCFLLAETSYTDKVYRDSYYSYYSKKLVPYKKDCVRISIFDGEIEAKDFTNSASLHKIESKYRGFLILRPTEPHIIGRSLISPTALKKKDFLSCTTKIQTTVNSIKVCVEGFPHSSQDTETISCAETTLWAVMEYFGSKYPEYKPVLPSTIIGSLNKLSFERLVPSKGLNIQQMSFALKEFGFGTRIYSRVFEKDFDRLLSTYVESGIPIILGVDNFSKGGNIGHAILCVGREKINDGHIDSIPVNRIEDSVLLKKIQAKNISFYDWDNIYKQFILIDDNRPAYQRAYLDKPVEYYNNKEWDLCQIQHFIVPLYPKIHLEAFEAKNYTLRFLASDLSPVKANDEVLIRFFLTSSRSFKHAVSFNPGLDLNVRDIILEAQMPKFVWIAELGTRESFKDNKAQGMLILDATEANLYNNYPLILAYYGDKLITPNLEANTLEEKIVSLSSFLIYENNLKPV